MKRAEESSALIQRAHQLHPLEFRLGHRATPAKCRARILSPGYKALARQKNARINGIIGKGRSGLGDQGTGDAVAIAPVFSRFRWSLSQGEKPVAGGIPCAHSR